MNILQALENFGVMLAFAEADAWDSCPIGRGRALNKARVSAPARQERPRARKRVSL